MVFFQPKPLFIRRAIEKGKLVLKLEFPNFLSNSFVKFLVNHKKRKYLLVFTKIL